MLDYCTIIEITFQVKLEIIPSYVLPANYFNELVERIYKLCPEKDSKNIINRLIGNVNKTSKTRESTIFTVKELKDAATALYAESKAQKETLKNIQKKGKKHDDKLEELINNAVARYFKGTVVLSGYNYKTADDEDGELDGMVVGVDENGKNVVVFIETKSDINSKWNDAIYQMNRMLLHWNYLKELYASNDYGLHNEEIKNFKIESCKDFEIRCAFGADHFDELTVGQFKQLQRYRW